MLTSTVAQGLLSLKLIPASLALFIFKTTISGAESAYGDYAAEKVKYCSMLNHDDALDQFKRYCSIAAEYGPNSVHPGILAALGLNVVVKSGRYDLGVWFSVNFCKAFGLNSLPPEFRSQLDFALNRINATQ